MSHLLLRIAEEALSRKLSIMVDQGKLMCISIDKTTIHNHTFLTDELGYFCKVTRKNSQVINHLFKEYGRSYDFNRFVISLIVGSN